MFNSYFEYFYKEIAPERHYPIFEATGKVVIPTTEEAACNWGEGIQWCTATRDGHNYFKMYNSRGPLYILVNKQNPKEKYQFHFETYQFMDKDDKAIDIDKFLAEDTQAGLAQKFYQDEFRRMIENNARKSESFHVITSETSVKLFTYGENLAEMININSSGRDVISAEWIKNIITGAELFEVDGYPIEINDVYDEINEDNMKIIKQVLITAHILGKDCGVSEKDLNNATDNEMMRYIEECNELIDVMQYAYTDAIRVGTESEFLEDFNKCIEREGWKRVGYDEIEKLFKPTMNKETQKEEYNHGSGGVYEYTFSTKNNMNAIIILANEGWKGLFTNDDYSDRELIFDFRLNEPYYGWSGFDRDTFNEELSY